MKSRPPFAVISLAIGAFLLPTIGGHLTLEGSQISSKDNLLVALLGGESAPLFAHLLVSLFFIVPLLHAFFTRKIIHVPSIKITGGLAIFAGAIGVSIFWSSFVHTSAITLLDWSLMIGSYFAVTACAGRKQGTMVLWGYLLGVSVCALAGLMEFRDMRVFDPGYRISALQLGPNQAGALFVTGICVSLPMMLTLERVQKLLLGLSVTLQGFALLLTQSKGAILCLPVGLCVLIVGVLVLRPVKVGSALAAITIPLLLAGLLTFGAQKAAQSPAGGGAPLARFSNSAEASTQSAGFRKLLWQTSVDLSKQKAHGWGIGTFWYESTRPGRVTQTTLAHQTFLQLAAEASFIAPIGLLSFLTMVFVRSLRGSKKLPHETKLSLIACYSGLAACIAHNFIDSDMYIFGLGASLFLMCGLVTAQSVDSQAPEFVFTMPRVAIGIAVLVAIPLGISLSYSEISRAQARGAIAEMNPDSALSHLNSAISSSISDGQAHFTRGRLTNNVRDLELATQLHPSPKFYRTLADAYFAESKTKEGFSALSRALERDPNNAPALLQYMKAAEQTGDPDTAEIYAKRLIDTESSTYFSVRSQAELVPTQTYEAREFLASRTSDISLKTKLLGDALKGYISYRNLTVPLVMRAVKVDPNADFAGENRDKIVERMNRSLKLISQLKQLQRAEGLDLAAEAAASEAILADLLK